MFVRYFFILIMNSGLVLIISFFFVFSVKNYVKQILKREFNREVCLSLVLRGLSVKDFMKILDRDTKESYKIFRVIEYKVFMRKFKVR